MTPQTNTILDENPEVVIDSYSDKFSPTGFEGRLISHKTKHWTTGDKKEEKVSENIGLFKGQSEEERKVYSQEYINLLRKSYIDKILSKFNKLISKEGDVSAAVYYSEIKDIINEIFKKFIDNKSEEGFLHIVSLLQSAFIKNKWRKYSDEQIKAIENLLIICKKNSEITIKDIEAAQSEIHRIGVDTLPTDTE